MKKILIINCHPRVGSFSDSIALAYKNGAISNLNELKEITIRDLVFSPNLANGYQKRTELEPDLVDCWEKIQWCDHMVWIHPVWWGGLPAMTKGFIDRLFLPGFVFQYRENSPWWDKLLTGKSARIITTMDQPTWFYWLFNKEPSINQLKKAVLQFCGVNPVRVTAFGPVKGSSEKQREAWLHKVKQKGLEIN